MPLVGTKRKSPDTLTSTPSGRQRATQRSPYLRTTMMTSRRRSSSQPSNLKFTIAPFRHSVATDPKYAERTWAAIREAIVEINQHNTGNLSFEELYRFAYNMVLRKHAEELYNGLQEVQKEHLLGVASRIRKAESAEFLKVVEKEWNHFKLSLGHVCDILMYMNRTWVRKRQVRPVNELGVYLFKEYVIFDDFIAKKLISIVLDEIDSDRNGAAIDAQRIRAITRMLADLGDDSEMGYAIYCDYFEEKFLERAAQFYAREAELFFAESSCPEYLRKAAERLEDEKARVNLYLDRRSLDKTREVVEDALLGKYMQRLVEMEQSGFVWMLRNNKVHDLRLMYTLLRPVPGGEDLLRKHLKKEILERGSALISDASNMKDTVPVVEALLALKEKYDHILIASFSKMERKSTLPVVQESVEGVDLPEGTKRIIWNSESKRFAVPVKKFGNAVNEAFERFLNSFSRAPEYLSLYVDKLLRQDFKSRTEDEIEVQLQAVITLFRYINERDAFERYYKQHLTKRLLHGKSASVDAETSFITKLKGECGDLYTAKIEQMFTDVNTTGETMRAYEEWKQENPQEDEPNVGLYVRVLKTGSWPIQAGPPCNVPEEVLQLRSIYKAFYDSKFSKRKLTWHPALGSAEVQASFQDGTVEHRLCVSAFAMCILMLYNEHNSLTYNEVSRMTNIEKTDLVRTLQSLSLGKYRVLTRDPKRKDAEILPSDRFVFNNNFKCRLHRIRIQMVSARKESDAEEQKTRRRIDDDRKPLIETAIVRVMKQRKILDHNLLIAEVTSLLSSRFTPDPSDIKKRIESLVDREFLERQEGQHATYKYVA